MQRPRAQRIPGAAVRNERKHTAVALLLLSPSWLCGREQAGGGGPIRAGDTRLVDFSQPVAS